MLNSLNSLASFHISPMLGSCMHTSYLCLWHLMSLASSYQYLVDNIRKHIEGWQTKYLLMASWATLIKASITSILTYAMQITLFPQKICHHIDKLSCNFLWGGSEQHKSCHTVSWDTVTLPKEAGGLGIPSTRHRNHAILMNQAWCLLSNPTSLWAQVLQAKYFP